MPSDSTPRSLTFPRRVPSGITAPGLATATIWPAATFGAPQTICRGAPSPASTAQTLSRSARGCFSALSTRATTKCSRPPTPWWWIASTLVPVMVRRSAICAVSSGGEQYSRSQASGTLISAPPPSPELLQEADVVVVEQPQVGNAVLEHRDPLDPHPEGEALDPLGVVAVLAHVLEHVGVDHPGAQDLDPALAPAQAAPLAGGGHAAFAVKARDVDLDARLGEREEVRSQPDLALRPEVLAGERQERALEVGHRHVAVHRQPLQLMELGGVGGVGVRPVGPSGD